MKQRRRRIISPSSLLHEPSFLEYLTYDEIQLFLLQIIFGNRRKILIVIKEGILNIMTSFNFYFVRDTK